MPAPISFRGLHFQVNSTSATLPCLEMPLTVTNSLFAAGMLKVGFSASPGPTRFWIVATPAGVSVICQHGGGTMAGGHTALVAEIQPRCCSTRYSGERESSFDTTPVRNWNCCGLRKGSESAIRSAARRRVRKSRGEQEQSRRRATIPNTARMNDFRMNRQEILDH